MNEEHSQFRSRVGRINDAWRNRARGEFILQSNGLLVRKQRRLRFEFPIRGLILAFVIAVMVKAYLIWFLGLELYQMELLKLLGGTSFEQAAARILMPDQLTMWVVGQYDWIWGHVMAWRQAMAEP